MQHFPCRSQSLVHSGIGTLQVGFHVTKRLERTRGDHLIGMHSVRLPPLFMSPPSMIAVPFIALLNSPSALSPDIPPFTTLSHTIPGFFHPARLTNASIVISCTWEVHYTCVGARAHQACSLDGMICRCLSVFQTRSFNSLIPSIPSSCHLFIECVDAKYICRCHVASLISQARIVASVREPETQDIISKLISRNDHTNSARSTDMTSHFHALRCSLALEQMHFVNCGSVKELNQILHHERIRHRCL